MTWDGWTMLNHEMTWGATGQVQDDSPGPGMASGSKVEGHESTQLGRSRIWVGDCRGRWCVKEKPLNHLLVVWNMNGLYCSIDWEYNDLKWRTHIFQRGWYTTNQPWVEMSQLKKCSYSYCLSPYKKTKNWKKGLEKTRAILGLSGFQQQNSN